MVLNLTMENHPGAATVLARIQRWLDNPDVVDMSINGPGEIWIEWADRGYERASAPDLTLEWAWLLCQALANVSHQEFPISVKDTSRKPVLSCTLPSGHRFHAILGPSAAGGMIIDIRRRRKITVELSSYGLSPEDETDLRDVVSAGGMVLVSGAPNSGKTTFANTLAKSIPAFRRIAKVQDVDEIDLPHANQISLLVNRFNRMGGNVLSYTDVIDSVLRFNCDTLIVGELSIDNAAAALRLLNTGSVGGFLATLHANSTLDALEAWRRNWEFKQQAGANALLRFLARSVDRIVQLRRVSVTERCVVGIARRDPESGELDIPWRTLLEAGE